MKTRHDGDCSIYASLDNSIPEAGICTCGYGHQMKRKGINTIMYSRELLKKLEDENKAPQSELIKKIMEENLK